jgi:hypothetical protein
VNAPRQQLNAMLTFEVVGFTQLALDFAALMGGNRRINP